MADTYEKKDNLRLAITQDVEPGPGSKTEEVPAAEIVTGLVQAYDAYQTAKSYFAFRKKMAQEALKVGIEFTEEQEAKLEEFIAKK